MTTVVTQHGTALDLAAQARELRDDLQGEVVTPDDDGYDEARRLWNGLHDRAEPGLIARCATTADVRRALQVAAEHHLELAVRGGGHNVAGTATTDGGLLLDLGPMSDVEVDVDARRAHVGGGATWFDVDAATQVHGLATPGGVVSDTGVGGLTLGGGIGWLRRRHGLSCDNLLGAQLVTADGEVREVTADDGDLLWALRGGGGGLGVVTRFDFALHEVGPEVAVAFTLYHGDRTREVLAAYRELTTDLDRDVSSFAILGTVPEDEEFPAATWGEPYAMLMAVAASATDRGNELVAPFAGLGDPMLDMTGTMPYVEVQQALDADYPEGDRYHWKSLHLPTLSDEVIDLAVQWAGRRASRTSTLDFWHLGGAMADVAPDATAFGDRSDRYLLGAEANWSDPATDAANVAWSRDTVTAFAPHSSGREYLNFPGFFEGGDDMRRAAHGDANHARLQRIRDAVDPDGLLRPSPHQPASSDR